MLVPALVGAATAAGVYAASYLLQVVQKPKLVCRDDGLSEFLMRHCSVLNTCYWPTFWCFTSRVQTIIGSLIRKKVELQFRREELDLEDGGRVALHWLDNPTELYPDPGSRPTVIFLPGLTGSVEEAYIRQSVQQARESGFRSVVFNYRGRANVSLQTRITYCASKTEDLAAVIKHIKSVIPESPILAVGFSLGGMILVNYLSKRGTDCRSDLKAAMTVSLTFNAFETTKSLEQPVNCTIFNEYLTKKIKKSLKVYYDMFANVVDMERVMSSRTLREFDEHFTVHRFGYENCDAYYRDASVHLKLSRIRVPLMCLNSADDVFSPGHAIPVEEANRSSHVALVITQYGGHQGFLEGIWPNSANFADRLFRDFSNAVFTQQDQLCQLLPQLSSTSPGHHNAAVTFI